MITNFFGIESFLETNCLPLPSETRCTSFGVIVLRWPVGDALLSCTLRYSEDHKAFIWSGQKGHRLYMKGVRQFIELARSREVLKGASRIVIRQKTKVYVEPVK